MFGIDLKGTKTSPPSRADRLGKITLPDHTGRDVKVSSLWAEGPAVVVFLRHYG
jgi:hypothetical protein